MFRCTSHFNRLGIIGARRYSDNYGILPESARVVIAGDYFLFLTITPDRKYKYCIKKIY